jgi:hypothetical protein
MVRYVAENSHVQDYIMKSIPFQQGLLESMFQESLFKTLQQMIEHGIIIGPSQVRATIGAT